MDKCHALTNARISAYQPSLYPGILRLQALNRGDTASLLMAQTQKLMKKNKDLLRTPIDIGSHINDPKLSDGGGWRDGCAGEGGGAASVTAGAVRCIA